MAHRRHIDPFDGIELLPGCKTGNEAHQRDIHAEFSENRRETENRNTDRNHA
jgi:hypothetical protein